MKKIAVYGASGNIGKVIVIEALERGHKVTGLSRSPEKLDIEHENFVAAKGDLMDVNSLTKIAEEHDAIVLSVSARAPDNKPENSILIKFTENILEVLSVLEKKPYVLQVGGANLVMGSTYNEIVKTVRDKKLNVPFAFEEGTPMHAVLLGHQISLEMYQKTDLSWTVLAPPIYVLGIFGKLDHETTKPSYRISTDELVIDSNGNSTIYVRDFAKAALIEIENMQHNQQVFTVGY